MASELAAYYVSIVPSAKGLTGKIAKEFAGVDREASKSGKSSGGKFSSAFKGSMAGIAGAFAAVGIGSFVKDAVKSAGDIEQSFGALDSVFKGSSGQMKQWSRKAAKDVGLTANEFSELGTLIGSQLKNGGTAMDELAPKTKSLITMGADLSSMFGGTTKDAVDALSSALKGERDPIEKYGVSLNQAKIEAEAASLGFSKVGTAYEGNAIQAATLSLITKQTADAQGNFAKESDTFAHKQQVMAAEWGNLTTKMGELFLPTLTTVFSFISDKAIPVLTEVVGGVMAFGAAFKAGDGDITSSGLPGFMERVGAAARGLYDLIVKGDYKGLLRTAFGWEEDSPAVGKILDIRDAALKVPGALADISKKLWDMKVPIGVVAGLIIAVLIPHWIALGIEALKSAAQQVLAWALARTAAVKAAFVHSGAVTAMVAGWLLMGARAMVQAAIIAGAWLIALGPIGWVIAAVAGVVAAFVLAYNNIGWFKDGVDAAMRWVGEAVANAFKWVQDVIGGVVGWFTGTVIPAWDAAVKSVGDFFTWLYETAIKPVFDGVRAVIQGVSTWFSTVIVPAFQLAVGFLVGVFQGIYNFLKPVFDSIGVIVNGFYLGFRGIFQLVSSIITNIVIPLFQGFWNRIVAVFTGIGTTISNWWNSAVAVFNTVVSFIRTVLAAVFTWYLNNVIKPVWNTVTSTIKNAWTNISNVFNTIVSFIRTALANAFNWFRDYVIKPVFDAIAKVVRDWWNGIVMPVFNTVKNFITNVLGPAFDRLYKTVIKPAFDGIGSAIKFVWEKIIKPVFDTIKTFITKTIPKAFEDGVKFVKTAWDKIQDIAKAPIKFVIDTVINDGLINAFNTIAGVLPGIDKLPRVALPKGFAQGGYTGDGGKYQPAGIVHAGEYVFTKEQTRKAGIGNLAAMAKSLTGYAKGGLVHPLPNSVTSSGFGPREGGFHNGIDFAAPTGTPVRAAGKGRVSQAAWSPFGGGNEIHIDHPNGLQTWYAHLSSFAVKAGQMVNAGNRIGAVGSTGNSTGPHLHYMVLNGGWPNFTNPSGYLAGGGDIPAGGTPWNPLSGIVDGLVSTFKDKFPGGGMIADMAIGVGKKILDSTTKWVTDKLSGHSEGSAYGPTVYDGGGWLENTGGAQLVQHNKRKPDAVLSSSQWDTMQRIADNSRGAGVTFTGPVHVRDENELASIISTRQRDAQAAYGF